MHDKKIILAIATLLLAGAACAEDAPAPAFTGHIDLVNKYVLRGVTSTQGQPFREALALIASELCARIK